MNKTISAPKPGRIESIKVKEGDIINKGQELIVIQTMKMQNTIFATDSGKIKSIKCKVGDPVKEGDVLIELE
uniref:Lipoyl-binding domain-containing protein n=1 Tax=Strongyloides stercoralis TaxID=6248 RepID=A0A0K0ENX5_STRER